MTAMLEREEWKAFSDFLALIASGLFTLIGLILALAGSDPAMQFHGCVLLGAAGLAFLYILTKLVERREPRGETGYADGVIRAGVIATVFWGSPGFLSATLSPGSLLILRSISICHGRVSDACVRSTPRRSSSPLAAIC